MTTSNQPSLLENRVLLITGGARRVGAEIARTLHGAGANVLIHYRSSADAARAMADELNSTRPGSVAIQCANLLEAGAAEALVGAALREFGQLDILINNASTFYQSQMGEVTSAHWDDLIGTNLKAPFFLSQAAAPSLRSQRGLIINILDIHALRPLKRHPVYSIAKAGLAMLTRSLARELGPHIRVNGIAPGPVLWPEGGIDEGLKGEIIAKTALKRHGTPGDVARTALFLAADAPYITGQVIAVDGGRSL
ncbi:MAG: pteridine reductase [Gammaproteobacteria bacterium]|nr:pteridine reductase [Gammaproteobacteria bacterium]